VHDVRCSNLNQIWYDTIVLILILIMLVWQVQAVACYERQYPSPVTKQSINIDSILVLNVSMVFTRAFNSTATGFFTDTSQTRRDKLISLVSKCMEIRSELVQVYFESRRQNYGYFQALSSIQIDSVEMAFFLEERATVSAFTRAAQKIGLTDLKIQSVTSNGIFATGTAVQVLDLMSENTMNLIIILCSVLGGVLIFICIIIAIWLFMRKQKKERENRDYPTQGHVLPTELVYSPHAARPYELEGDDGRGVASNQV
jgi:hypothetical protein